MAGEVRRLRGERGEVRKAFREAWRADAEGREGRVDMATFAG